MTGRPFGAVFSVPFRKEQLKEMEMTYYAYLLCNEQIDPDYRWRTNPICCVEFVKGKKLAQKRLEELCERHPQLPAPDDDSWHRITHRGLKTDDNRVIERLKLDIRRRMATVSIDRHGSRRLWAKTVGAPAGWFRLSYQEANRIMTDVINDSGLYQPGL